MPVFVFGQTPSGNAYARDQQGLIRGPARYVRASTGAPGSSGGAGVTDRFSPVTDRLEVGSVVDQWIPRDLPGLNNLFMKILLRDGVSGTAIDVWASAAWSSFDIVGIQDTGVRRFFEEAAQIFGPNAEDMIPLTTEYLALGRVAASMIYDESKGYWTDYVPRDQSLMMFTPIPARGFDPKMDLRIGTNDRAFFGSHDYRDKAALSRFPKWMLDAVKSGNNIPLDPYATMFAARRVSFSDHIGTSILSRILPAYAIEIALLDATVTGARRRAGSLLHITVGKDGVWEADEAQMREIGASFQRGDEDPVGGIVTTGDGISATEVRQGGQIWKLSDEWDFLSNYKMMALGLSPALMDPNTTYSNSQNARTLFVERLRQLRMFIVRDTYLKMFETLARAHGFRKRTVAEIEHRVRVNRNSGEPAAPYDSGAAMPRGQFSELMLRDLGQTEAMQIPRTDLLIPDISWHKPLAPEVDQEALEVMRSLKDEGIPIPARMWASRAGINLDDIISGLPSDLQDRKKFASWRAVVDSGDFSTVQDNAGSEKVETIQNENVVPDNQIGIETVPLDDVNTPVQQARALRRSAIWDRASRLPGLSYEQAARCVAALSPEILRNKEELMPRLYRHFDGNRRRVEVMSYVLMRAGLTPHRLPISAETVSDLADHVFQNGNGTPGQRMHEISRMHRIVHGERNRTGDAESARRVSGAETALLARDDLRPQVQAERQLPEKNLLSGVSPT